MNKTGMFVLALFAATIANGATLEEQTAEVLKQTPTRQEQALRAQLRKPFPPKGPGGPGMWHHEDFALAAYWFNEKTAEADDGILSLQEELYPAALESFEARGFHRHAYLLERIYFLFSSRSSHFPGRMSVEAENALLEML